MVSSKINYRKTCRVCGNNKLKLILNLGKLPLVGAFLPNIISFKEEKFYPLKVFFCEKCKLLQVLDIIDPEILFAKYNYISSVIPSLVNHFQELSKIVKEKYLSENGKLLEFGCNDGVFLNFFKDKYQTVGVDPSVNVSKIAKKKGFNVINDYFNPSVSQDIFNQYGQFDVISGSNVFAHTDHIYDLLNAAKIVIKPNGILIIEVHYLLDLIEKKQYDTIYHEHLSYFSVTSLKLALQNTGFNLFDVERIPMHGGGIRIFGQLANGRWPKTKRLLEILSQEKKLITNKTFDSFSESIKKHKTSIRVLLKNIKSQNKHIVGYGAAGRGTILLNYCNISNKYIDYIVDASPLRSGKFMPGVHIPIYPISKLHDNHPEYVLIIAWNYAQSIIEQESSYISKDQKFIIPLPEIKIL